MVIYIYIYIYIYYFDVFLIKKLARYYQTHTKYSFGTTFQLGVFFLKKFSLNIFDYFNMLMSKIVFLKIKKILF